MAKIDYTIKKDYEFEAFKEGFNKGMFTAIAVFEIKPEEIKAKIPFDILYSRVYKLYQIWQNTIKDNKIEREESILSKRVSMKVDKFKKALIHYIDSRRL